MKKLKNTEFNEELNEWISSIDDLIRIHGINYASNIIENLIGAAKIKGLKLLVLLAQITLIQSTKMIKYHLLGTMRLNILSGLMSDGMLLLWF